MSVQCREVIERCNLQLCRILATDYKLRTSIWELLENEMISYEDLQRMIRTFRQLMIIDKGNGLTAWCCNKIMEIMEQRDQEEPIYLDEIYPYIKKPQWQISMNEISYFKVHVQNGLEWSFALSHMEKGENEKEEKIYIDLYPFDGSESFPREEEEHCYRVYFEDEGKYQTFMKRILIDGFVDLSTL